MGNSTQVNLRGFKYISTCLQKRRQRNLKKRQENLFNNINLNYNLKENIRLNKRNKSVWKLIFSCILNLFKFK